MADPDYQVWQLVGKPSDPGSKWQCRIPKNRTDTKPYAKGRSFYFGPQDKKHKLSKGLVDDGDFMVVDLTQKPAGVAHHVPQKLIRDGNVYYCRNDTPSVSWELVISAKQPVDAAASGTKNSGTGTGAADASGAADTGATGGKGKKSAKSGSKSRLHKVKSPPNPPELEGFEAHKGALVAVRVDDSGIPGKKLREIADATARAKGKSNTQLPDDDEEDLLDRYRGSFVYYVIRGTDSSELNIEERVWNVVHQFADESETRMQSLSPKAYGRLLEDDRIDIISRLNKALDIDALADQLQELSECMFDIEIENMREEQDEQLEEIRDRIKDIFEEAVPSATPGSTAILAAMNTAFGELQRQVSAGAREGHASVSNFNTTAGGLTQTGFENAGILVAIAFDIVKMGQLRRDEAKGEPDVETWQGLISDFGVHIAYLTTGTTKLAELIASAAYGATSEMASGLGAGGGVASAVIGYLNAGRSSLQGVRTARRSQKVLKIKWDVQRRKKGKDNADPELLYLTDYIYRKLDRRFNKQAVTAMTGAIGATSGVLFALVAFGLINAWNPLGWTLLILSSAMGLGLVMYKSIRHWTKGHRRRHRRGKSHPGTVDEFTDRTLALMLDDTADSEDRRDACRLLQALVWKQFRLHAARSKRRQYPVVRSRETDQDGNGVVVYEILKKRPGKSKRQKVGMDSDIESFYEGGYFKDNNGKWIQQEISAETFRHVRALVKRHVKK